MVSTHAADRFLKAPFLADLDASSRQALLHVLREHHASAGTILLQQDQPNDRIYFLIEGSVAILRSSTDGRTEHILDLHAPTAFGETSYFQRKPQLVTVRTITDVWYLTLERTAHHQLRESDPRASEQLATAAIRVLAGHFEIIDQRVAEMIASQPNQANQTTEWDRFRARLFGKARL